MSNQREFNEYITEKVQSISQLFGTRVVRSETINEDEYNYIRPYKKTITPFTAEVSAAVFASAENNPLEYIVKNFYPSKATYPEQIQKLYLLVEELETLREAKQIIENYKKDRQAKLESMAKRAAGRVMKYKRPVSMDPMPAFERRIVHSALQEYPELETSSTGEEPRRYVVIKYKG